MNFENKRFLVVGSGRSGIGAMHLLHRKGADAILLDQNKKGTVEAIRASLHEEDRTYGRIVLGELEAADLRTPDVVVLSPAVPTDAPLVEAFRGQGVPVWSELELGFSCEKGRMLGITGTNGKTTTTTLVGRIMEDCGYKTHVVGNIGNSYAGEAMETTADSVSVAEISSFQLENIDTLHPAVSAILNITPDHLNRHYTMDNYAAVKEKITANQTKNDTCVLNYDDLRLREFGPVCPARVVWFSSQTQLSEGYFLDGDDICYASGENDTSVTKLMNIFDMRLVGTCNVENVMAAIAMTHAAGLSFEEIIPVVRDFPPVEHRIEYVGTRGGVEYYNDSKATNPDAAIQGIRAMRRPTILIGGGYDKGNSYDEWIEAFDGKVKELVLIGQTAEAIAACARKHGFTDITFCDTFDNCLEHCTLAARDGDAVLLSPACASWGMFENYEIRGKMFKEYVDSLPF